MERLVMRNSRGVSLIEVLISVLVISMVGMALMQTTLLSVRTNVKNLIRDGAITLAQDRMNDFRMMTYNTVTVDPALKATPGAVPDDPAVVPRDIRNFQVNYSLLKTIIDIGAEESKQITIAVGWTHEGQQYTFSTTSLLKRFKL